MVKHKVDINLKDNTPVQISRLVTNCGYCGKGVRVGEAVKCQKFHFIAIKGYVCDECARKCKSCGKYFCPKHINNHGC